METKQKYERALRVSAPRERNPGVPLDLDWVRAVRVNRSAVERRAATIPTRRTVKKQWQAAWLLRAVTCVDLTTLQSDDTPTNVLRLCAKAKQPVRRDLLEALGATELGIVVAAVCVYHRYVPTAVGALAGSGLPVAAVSTGFPAGLNPFPQRLEEIRASVEAGAQEIDVVITRAHALAGDWEALYRELKAFREACGDAHLKVILGTGDLATLTNVARASRAAMMAGADFIKTSTGKEAVNATLPVGVVMTRQIREHLEATGHAAGFKPAGGTRSDRGVEDAARAGFPGWSGPPGPARARYLYALAREVQRHARLLAVLESMDNGKSIRETRDLDIPLVARHFYHHAGWAQLQESEFAGATPVGVVGQIIPWNFPLLMVAWKVAPALAAGNTVVLKPAEFTPLTALAFAEIVAEAGLPPGVLNVITGDGRTGALLVDHPDVDKIAFTGSTEVGRVIRKATAGSGKKLSLELGGKSPFIVFDDADLDSVVEGVVDAIWFNQGQVCCAGSRLLVHEGVAERLVAKLRARMEKLRIGPPLDKAIDMGAIVAPVQLERIRGLVTKGVEEGATMWQPSWACPTEGYFYPPTLFTDVSPAATIAQVEIFGPVLVAMSFRTPKEALELATNTPYGLAASVWTENLNLAIDVAPKIKAGVVWINCTNVFDAASGFGGYRESGFGREGGREGMWEYLKPASETGKGKGERSARNPAPKRAARTAIPHSPFPRSEEHTS